MGQRQVGGAGRMSEWGVKMGKYAMQWGQEAATQVQAACVLHVARLAQEKTTSKSGCTLDGALHRTCCKSASCQTLWIKVVIGVVCSL